MNALSLILKPTAYGWAVYLTDGHEAAHFRGLGRSGARSTTSPGRRRLCRPQPAAPAARQRGTRANPAAAAFSPRTISRQLRLVTGRPERLVGVESCRSPWG